MIMEGYCRENRTLETFNILEIGFGKKKNEWL